MWDDNSEQILVSGYGENYEYKALTLFNVGSGEKKEFKVESDMIPLYIENENVVCIGGPFN